MWWRGIRNGGTCCLLGTPCSSTTLWCILHDFIRRGIFSYLWFSCDQPGSNSIQWEYLRIVVGPICGSIRHGIFSYQWLSCDQIGPNSIQCEYRFSEFQDGFKLLAVNSISVYAKLLAVISLYVCAAATDVSSVTPSHLEVGITHVKCSLAAMVHRSYCTKCSNTVASGV